MLEVTLPVTCEEVTRFYKFVISNSTFFTQKHEALAFPGVEWTVEEVTRDALTGCIRGIMMEEMEQRLVDLPDVHKRLIEGGWEKENPNNDPVWDELLTNS